MRTLKFHLGAIATAVALSTATFLGAVALHVDGGDSNTGRAENSAIVYSGGYGPFPVAE